MIQTLDPNLSNVQRSLAASATGTIGRNGLGQIAVTSPSFLLHDTLPFVSYVFPAPCSAAYPDAEKTITY